MQGRFRWLHRLPLVACHGGHRPPGPRAGQTARPGNRKGQDHDRGSRELGRQPHRGPGVRSTGAGIARAMFRVAVSGRREQEVALFTVVVWRDQAEHAAQSLAKGSRVVVVGRLQQRSWTAEDAAPGPSKSWLRSWDRACGGNGDHDQDHAEPGAGLR
ncbi:MAG: single-stranded DNA-binding protein [Actinomycetes bacterium]